MPSPSTVLISFYFIFKKIFFERGPGAMLAECFEKGTIGHRFYGNGQKLYQCT
jgi:hypothetical protein